jgi:hypothetical protein
MAEIATKNETHGYFSDLLKRVEEQMKEEYGGLRNPEDAHDAQEVVKRTMLYIRHWFLDENGFDL